VKRRTHHLILLLALLPFGASATTTRHGSTWARIENLQDSVLAFAAEQCRFPTYDDLVRESEKSGPLQGQSLQDAWGQPLIYRHPAEHGTAAFDLYSIGVNGIDERGAGDDISNWQAFDAAAYSGSFDPFEWGLIASIFDLPVLILVWLCWRGISALRRRPAA
jgi:hypothetical protein